MTTDFRALCAELADSVELLLEMRPLDAKPMAITEDRLIRARAALAAPEQGPTDEELYQFWLNHDLWDDDIGPGDVAAIARAALARWGRPAVGSVPVAERLPGPEDCDDKGRCWWLARLPFPFTHWLPHWALPVPQEGADG